MKSRESLCRMRNPLYKRCCGKNGSCIMHVPLGPEQPLLMLRCLTTLQASHPRFPLPSPEPRQSPNPVLNPIPRAHNMVPPCFEGAESISDLGLPQFQLFRGFPGFGVFLDLLNIFWMFLFFWLTETKGSHVPKRECYVCNEAINPNDPTVRRRLVTCDVCHGDFHLTCAGLTYPPRFNSWACPTNCVNP